MATVVPRSEQLLAARHTHVPRGVGVAHPIVVGSASGATVWDVDGRPFIDFVGGIGVLNVGHNHPKVAQAVRAQLERLSHVAFQVATYEPYVALAERLNALAPVRGPAKTLLVTTGAEAVENAVKIARAATGRPGIVAFHHGFHGRTLLGMTLTGKAKPYRQSFGPFAPEVYQSPFPYAYRGWDVERALAAFDELLLAEVAPNRVAAVIFEPVLGEGGFVPAPPAFVAGLRERADAHGFLLIADEIQSGFGRTGRLFALEHTGVEADLVTVAKSLAGGLPLAGVVGTGEPDGRARRGRPGRHVRRQPVGVRRRPRRARRLRARGGPRSRQRARRAAARGARRRRGPLPAGGRGAGSGRDARDRARRGPRDPPSRARAGATRSSSRRGTAACCCSPPACTGTWCASWRRCSSTTPNSSRV